jgi:iron complex outermembrane receptor protein
MRNIRVNGLPATAAVLLLYLPSNDCTANAELELVRVTAQQVLSENSAPFANSTTLIPGDASPNPPRALAELLRNEPGVEYNGQGGLFQTVTIRGMGRQRIGSYYLDIPLLSERRAGTAASFIDPVIVDSVELVRGPSTIMHGYGAIGGLLRVQPRDRQGFGAGLGWSTGGEENLQYVAYGDDDRQFALSHRGADESTSASGDPLNTGFDQYNVRLALNQSRGDLRFGLDSLFTYADDIGKSNNLFPHERITDYPRERHWLGQLSAERDGHWRGSVFFHLQDLETRVERVEKRLNEVDNSAADFGAKLVLFRGENTSPLRIGLDYLARRSVDADEKQTDFDDGRSRQWNILRGEQDDIALFADLEHSYRAFQWAAGLRLAHTWQDAEGFEGEDETYATGFYGLEWFTSDALSLSFQASAGQRPANLSERYFSGSTGRGLVVGNPDLDSEKAITLNLGSRWEQGDGSLAIHAYYTHLEDLIERVEVAPGVLGFRNNREGDIFGAELTARYELGDAWLLSAGGSYQDGEDDDGDPLQDISPNTLSAGLEYRRHRWNLQAHYSYRFSRDDVAATESGVDTARLLSTRAEYHVGRQFSVALWSRNLLDEEYVISTDELSTEGEERTFGIALTWHSH